MRARIRDTEIFFDIEGPGLIADGHRMRERPTAFLIHGGPGSDHTGLKMRYGQLANKMQLVYFDHRGQGRSARSEREKYTLDENVEDMEALRHYLGLGAIVSLGTSYGGLVAMAHAARYPDAVSHLILVVPVAAHSGFIERARQLVAERGTPEQIDQCDNLFAGRLDTPEKLHRYYEVMTTLYTHREDADLSKGAFERAILTPEPINRAFAPGGFLRDFDLRTELAAITAPTLILAGRHDWICAPEFSEEIHRLIPGSDLRVFEESAHSIGGDEPQQFLDAVAGFVVYKSKLKKSVA
jgi:proline iminopeptidase